MFYYFKRLSRSTADEEPLVDGRVNLLGSKLLVGRELRQLSRADTVRGVVNSSVGAGSKVSLSLIVIMVGLQ